MGIVTLFRFCRTYDLISSEVAHGLWVCSSFISCQRSIAVIRLLITVCDTSLCIMNNWIGRLVVRWPEYERGNCWINELSIFIKLNL